MPSCGVSDYSQGYAQFHGFLCLIRAGPFFCHDEDTGFIDIAQHPGNIAAPLPHGERGNDPARPQGGGHHPLPCLQEGRVGRRGTLRARQEVMAPPPPPAAPPGFRGALRGTVLRRLAGSPFLRVARHGSEAHLPHDVVGGDHVVPGGGACHPAGRLGGRRPLDLRSHVPVPGEDAAQRHHVVGAPHALVQELRQGVRQPLVLDLAVRAGARGDVRAADLPPGGRPADPEGHVVAADVPRPARLEGYVPA
jgi:hypothetical protein